MKVSGMTNTYYACSGVAVLLLGIAHTVIGEKLIFRRLRDAGRRDAIVPTHGGDVLLERHVRILWATWHVATALGWGIAGVLLWLAHTPATEATRLVAFAIVVTLLDSAGLVFFGTHGRHPGWIGFLGAAILVLLGIFVG